MLANCTDCGALVELPSEDVVLHIAFKTSDEIVGQGSYYYFICPSCQSMVQKTADFRIAQLLAVGMCPIEVE